MAYLSKPKLWAKIEAYEFPDLQDGTRFEDYVKNNIKAGPETVAQTVTEYRRFIYLSMVTPGEVVPPKVVDEIWRCHLRQTQEYLERFCPDVLGRKLLHVPCPANFRERSSYGELLRLYQKEFGKAPPVLFWPRVKGKDYRILGVLATVAVIGAAVSTENWTLLFGLMFTVPFAISPVVVSSSDSSIDHTSLDLGGGSDSSCGGE